MLIYNTTNGNYITKLNEKEFYVFDKNLVNITGQENPGEATQKLRSDAKAYKEIEEIVNKLQGKIEQRTVIDKINGYDVFIDKNTFGLFVDFNGEIFPIEDKELLVKLKEDTENIKSIKTSIKNTGSNLFTMGDRVMLYGPTGTGKTYTFLNSVNNMMAAGKLNDYAIIGITEGFEDMDFFAHIVPVEGGGVRFKEKAILELFRRAAAGEKIAILLDELNRGSKSFMNLVLKMLDAVNGKTYIINNFIHDEIIEVPIENILWFSAMNLGGKYSGTNILDEALFDRFNVIQYSGYDPKVEDDMANNFGEYKKQALDIVANIRELYTSGEIKSPISTRGIKVWAEKFINTSKSGQDFISTFMLSILFRIISVDDMGNPNEEEKIIVLQKFKELGFIS